MPIMQMTIGFCQFVLTQTTKGPLDPWEKNGKLLISQIGVTVGNEIPKYYPEWRAVPDHFRELIWSSLTIYFYFDGYLYEPFGTQIRESIMTIAGDRYKKARGREVYSAKF